MARVNLTDRAVQAAKAEPGKRLELHDALTPGLTLRVTDKGVKSWVLRYRAPDGRSQRHKVGDASRMGLRAARLEAGRLKSEIDKGADPLSEKRKARVIAKALTVRTFRDLSAAYWIACETGEWKPKKKRKRSQTIEYEKGIHARHIEPVLGPLPLPEIKRATIKGLLRDMAARGIGAQTNRTHALIRQIFNFGISEEHVAVNPAMGFDSFHDPQSRRRIWTDGELKRLWAALSDPSELRDPGGERVYVSRAAAIAIQLCALLLQRRVEVAGMATDELDLDAGTWVIPPERMKNGKAHLVTLPAEAVALIREALTIAAEAQARREDRDGDKAKRPNRIVVFPGPRDVNTPIRADSLTHAMDKVRSCIGVEGATIHDLRRTGSTALTSERIGVSPFIRSKVLGHGTDAGGGAAVSAMHYDVNEYVAEKRRALEAWEALLMRVVGRTEAQS
ncbi:tyrosine-type recombinase/integrase [Brevundimonas sp. VNH65]|uniref:tyrosine-type recombinase/integrase n=1 Tax=Brevundimonas sp. VNH65 TaxID=3400917 RepID=UPI003C050E31